MDLPIFVLDTEYIVYLLKIAVNEIFVSLDRIIRKYHKLRLRLHRR